ncbi:MAG: protein kinase, partial [Acidobacteria bacterium]|nr:protein kinase [Acidobacteriota bacterium]
MNYSDLIGKTLDEKYQIERELGRGGMGTVYLATHLGTERPVAIKVIAPQFMKRPEFVERFRREARAAGRLRHPNVVDVTDFGFAQTDQGQVAYLVMEYLDGCTLGEILEEEKNLPVSWTLDILEQVCSAVHEAHEQGIIHRDLKPDNIWLEPNQRGGYTVKVLDFGIAKLEAHDSHDTGEFVIRESASPTFASGANTTFAGHVYDETIHDSASPTRIGDRATMAILPDRAPVVGSDRETLIQPISNGDESGTLVLKARADGEANEEAVQTKIISGDNDNGPALTSHSSLLEAPTSSDLTRVGAVLGTPLYMSPEQCRGDKLDARSDIYSLGVIAYQMLSGDTPFKGDFTKVMESHKFIPPPPLDAKKVRKKLKRVIDASLAKGVDDRPQSAEAFANSLRSRSEGIFGLLRRAGMIYTEHIQKFLSLSMFFFLPMILLTGVIVGLSFLRTTEVIPSGIANGAIVLSAILNSLMTAFCAVLIVGTITWIVTQSLAVPLRPIKLRAALYEARKKWKTFLGLGILSSLMPIIIGVLSFVIVFGLLYGIFWLIFGNQDASTAVAIGLGLCAFVTAFLLTSVWMMLIAPVAMMENLRGREAVKRSKSLVSRSFITALAAYVIMFLIPAIAAGSLTFVVNATAKAFDLKPPAIEARRTDADAPPAAEEESSGEKVERNENVYDIDFGRGRRVTNDASKSMQVKMVDTVLETLLQILLLPIQIVVISFTAIIVALIYLKTRQAEGESLHDLLSKFEESDRPRKKWQERVRQ